MPPGCFRESALAHRYLDGLSGLEIGGSAHNAFGLDTRNVDYTGDLTTVFKREEIKRCGRALPVDIVASGDAVPLPDKSVAFVISSHVIEHFHDPVTALLEWQRLATQYVYIICPQRDALPDDRVLPLTTLSEVERRHATPEPCTCAAQSSHCTRWTSATLAALCATLGYTVLEVQDPDDKVGNGFALVLAVPPSPPAP